MANFIFLNGQQRARQAFDFATEVNESDQSKYATVVKKFPMMVKVNGLTYSLAFAFSKRKKEVGYRLILEQIHDWLKKEPQQMLAGLWGSETEVRKDKKAEILMKVVLELETTENLMWTTQEVIQLFSWLKRFVGEEKE